MEQEPPEESAHRTRYRNLFAVASALIGALLTGALFTLLSMFDGTPETADMGILVAISLPGAFAGAIWWAVLAYSINRYTHNRPYSTAVAHMICMAPGTVVGGMIGYVGVGAFQALMGVVQVQNVALWSFPSGGIGSIGALAGATAALVAHTGFAWAMIRAYQRITADTPDDTAAETDELDA